MSQQTIQMLWVRGALSRLEQLSMASFLRNGHPVELYTYQAPDNVPPGVALFDAREVIPEADIFVDSSVEGIGSLGPFSDIFRFTLLKKKGGIWCGTDVVCVKPLQFAENMTHFFATEPVYTQPGEASVQPLVASCAFKVPPNSPLIDECLATARATDLSKAPWGAIGPRLLNTLVPRYGLGETILKPNVFCPYGFWQIQAYLTGIAALPPECYAIHFWNEMWRRNFLDKNGNYQTHCLYERLKAHYLCQEAEA